MIAPDESADDAQDKRGKAGNSHRPGQPAERKPPDRNSNEAENRSHIMAMKWIMVCQNASSAPLMTIHIRRMMMAPTQSRGRRVARGGTVLVEYSSEPEAVIRNSFVAGLCNARIVGRDPPERDKFESASCVRNNWHNNNSCVLMLCVKPTIQPCRVFRWGFRNGVSRTRRHSGERGKGGIQWTLKTLEDEQRRDKHGNIMGAPG